MWENHGSLVVMAARRASLLLDLQAGGTADAHCTTPISSTIDYLPSSDNLTSRLDLHLGAMRSGGRVLEGWAIKWGQRNSNCIWKLGL